MLTGKLIVIIDWPFIKLEPIFFIKNDMTLFCFSINSLLVHISPGSFRVLSKEVSVNLLYAIGNFIISPLRDSIFGLSSGVDSSNVIV
jgi:hypothetical protein